MITVILGAGVVVMLLTVVTLVVVLVTQLPQRVAVLVAVEITKRLDQGLMAEWWGARLSATAAPAPASHPAPISGLVTERFLSPRLAPPAQDAAPRSDPSTTYDALLHDKPVPGPGPGMVAAGLGPRPSSPRRALGSDPTLPSMQAPDAEGT